jgi:hypothetical protein
VINVGISMQEKWSDHLYIAIGSWWIAFKLKKRCISIQESTTGFHLTQQGMGMLLLETTLREDGDRCILH